MDNLSKDFPAIYENFNSFLTNPNWNPILCPYHNDKNKSGSINPTLKRFMCFAGCKAKSFEQLEADLNGELDVKESNTEEMETPQEIIDKYKLEFSKRLNFYNDLKVYPKYDYRW